MSVARVARGRERDYLSFVGQTTHGKEQEMEYTQPPLFYTEEEFNLAVTNASAHIIDQERLDLARLIERAKDNLNLTIAENTLGAIKANVADYTISRETGVEVYNSIAVANGWAEIKGLNSLFTVEVTYKGNPIGEFEDVEAEDGDSAAQEVADNVEIEAEMTINLNYNGNRSYGSTQVDEWDISDDIHYSATEQD